MSASSNQANPFRTHKVKVFWQGPYEVVAGSGPTSYQVRLLGDDSVSEVHWKKLRRLAGPEFQPDEEVVASALHDRQRFKVEKFDDWIVDEGEAELLVRWQHHGEDERTWEPLQQLLEDVPAMVRKYVVQVDAEELTHAMQEAQAALEAGSQDEAPAETTSAPTTTPESQTLTQNQARDARAAARAHRN